MHKLLAALGLFIFLAVPSVDSNAQLRTGAQTETIAGTGRPGTKDGGEMSATFLLPVGIAVARDGAIYVSDQAAQRIRLIAGGMVATVAGSGALLPDGLSVAGGYRDGAAARARFNWPSGIAIGPDGALYIADAGNQCIRKFLNGMVSTVVGKPSSGPAVDGDATTARFVDPRAVAFDRAGDLYIADYGGGLRRWSTNGQLSTRPLASTVEKTMLGVAVDDSDDLGTVAVSTPDQVISYDPSSGANEAFRTTVAEGDRAFGDPDALVAIDHREFLFSDPSAGNVRYMRFPARPYVNSIFTRVIAGGDSVESEDNNGFADGPFASARFFDPAGLAVHDNEAFVADAGNRRIRRLTLPRFVLSEAGTVDVVPADGNHVEVAFIGSSSSYYDSLGDDSICGQIERSLNASHRISAAVRCHPVRIDGSPLTALRDYIVNYLAPNGMNAIVLQLSKGELTHMEHSGPSDMMAKYQAVMGDIVSALRPKHTKLIVVWNYSGGQLDGAENFVYREHDTKYRESPMAGYDFHEGEVEPLFATLTQLQIPQYDLFDDLSNYERSAPAVPLFNTNGEGHPTDAANAVMGSLIANYLLSLPASESGLGGS